MFYKPEFIIYLWLLPVIFMIVIPAAFSALREIRVVLSKKTENEKCIQGQGAFAHA